MFFKKVVNKLNKTLFTRRVNRKLKTPLNRVIVDTFNIGCIVDNSFEDLDFLNEKLAHILNVEPHRVRLLKITYDTQSNPEVIALDTLEVHWKKGPKDALIESFLLAEYKVLINLYKRPHPVLNWLSLQIKTTFRIGMGEIDPALNDFIIHLKSSNAQEFLSELKKYATRLDILNNE